MNTPLKFFFLFVFLIACSQTPGKEVPSSLYYLPSYGQSLSVGWTAKPVVSDSPDPQNLMFKGGIRPYELGNDRSAFVPMQESVSPDSARGETPLSGAVQNYLLFGKSRNSDRAAKVRFLCAANGVGGASIASLGKGSSAYARILDDLKAAHELMGKSGKFSMPAFLWTQGETDQQNKKSPGWYKEQMAKLISDLNDDAREITGQKTPVLCFGYQVASHLHYYRHNPTDYAAIAVAQLEMALDENSHYIMTTPMYHLDYSDGVHLSAAMSRLYGAHIGYVMKKVLVDKVKWKPVHPVAHKIKRKGNIWEIHLQFFVPEPPLVIDEKSVAPVESCGFSLVSEKEGRIPVKSVRLDGKKGVVISVEKDPSGSSLRYGMTINELRASGPQTGARGNLRDSQGSKVKTTIGGKSYRLDNWCPFFDYKLK